VPPEIPAGIGVWELLRILVRHPWHHLGRRWNYKSAVMSSLFRGLLFFFTNISAGPGAALAALSTEFWFRFLTAGYYGALTQAFRRVEPARTAMIAAMIVLPTVGHGLEFLVHWLRGTPNLSASIGVSILFTAFSTSFNLFAMRRGALIVGDGSGSLLHDFRRMPALIAAFVLGMVRPLKRLFQIVRLKRRAAVYLEPRARAAKPEGVSG
jgi:hypothetical protein